MNRPEVYSRRPTAPCRRTAAAVSSSGLGSSCWSAARCPGTLRVAAPVPLFVNEGALRLTNSTVSGNTAESTGGGLHNTGGGEIWLINSTLSGNSAGASGGAVYSFMSTTYLTNTLVDGDCALDRAPILSSGHNLESPGNTCGLDQPTDESGVSTEDLKLGPLSDNDGATTTHALLPGSVAVDRIPKAMCEVDEDQRGVARPQGGTCDVGAFEQERSR